MDGQNISHVRKRNGELILFNKDRIVNAVWKAMRAVNEGSKEEADMLADKIMSVVDRKHWSKGVPSVEDIQDITEEMLIIEKYVKTAKAYILYRKQHRDMRDMANHLNTVETIEDYLNLNDWRIRENANMNYSLQGLNNHISGLMVSDYWLNRLYPENISKGHKRGDFHIHDLSTLGAYCVGWDLQDLLTVGFGGVSNKIESKPPKHLSAALGQIVNYIYTLQGETAGAQAFSNFDTYLAPFIRYDGLEYSQVKKLMQAFLYNMNVPTRVGFQTPFSNITLDLTVPNFMKEQAVIIGGKLIEDTYGDFQKEMNMINMAFTEVMMDGDSNGRVFTFPIPTYNISKDFDWENPIAKNIFEMTAKYGVPYFSNFVKSDMSPKDARSMCCRLRLDNRELRKRGGGLFGSNPLTGSIGVFTINLPRIGYLAKDEDEYFERLDRMMDYGRESLEIKRKLLEDFTDKGLYPYSKHYLRTVKKANGKYWNNHFSTIGLIGMNESVLNFMGVDMLDTNGRKFALKVMDHMRDRIRQYQEESECMFNLEATPGEGTSHRLARLDKQYYPDIKVANENTWKESNKPYYTNSTQFHVQSNLDLFEAMDLQDDLQIKYTGGTVFHGFLGERIHDWKVARDLVKKIAYSFKMPYYTLSPTFSVCPVHGYVAGEHTYCPKCDREIGYSNMKRLRDKGKEIDYEMMDNIVKKRKQCEVYSRVVGYIRPVTQWNDGKQEEFKHRKVFDSSTNEVK